jgi:hypothetical protein
MSGALALPETLPETTFPKIVCNGVGAADESLTVTVV